MTNALLKNANMLWKILFGESEKKDFLPTATSCVTLWKCHFNPSAFRQILILRAFFQGTLITMQILPPLSLDGWFCSETKQKWPWKISGRDGSGKKIPVKLIFFVFAGVPETFDIICKFICQRCKVIFAFFCKVDFFPGFHIWYFSCWKHSDKNRLIIPCWPESGASFMG